MGLNIQSYHVGQAYKMEEEGMNDVMKHYQQILAVCHFLAAGEWQLDQLEIAAAVAGCC